MDLFCGSGTLYRKSSCGDSGRPVNVRLFIRKCGPDAFPPVASPRQWCRTGTRSEPSECFLKEQPLKCWLDMNHADVNTMRTKARGAIGFLKGQLLETGAVEPVIALLFSDRIEQIQFDDRAVLDHFDVRTMKSFDYVRRMVAIKQPQSAMIALDVRMAPVSEESGALPETTAIFVMLDSPLLTIQVILPYSRSGRGIVFSKEQFTEMTGAERDSPCLLLKLFPNVPAIVS
jgi:hypothetical protein